MKEERLQGQEETIKLSVDVDNAIKFWLEHKLKKELRKYGDFIQPINIKNAKRVASDDASVEYEYTFKLPDVEEVCKPVEILLDRFIQKMESLKGGYYSKGNNISMEDKIQYYRRNINTFKDQDGTPLNLYSEIVKQQIAEYDKENPRNIWQKLKNLVKK
jgi:hypothetical protein